jgi:hypothetical protein
MKAIRPLGAKIIASYFFLKSAVLLCVGAVGFLRPELQDSANEFISHLAATKLLHIVEYGVTLAPLFALFEVGMGSGFWFLKSWARYICLAEIYVYFCRGIVGLLLLWEMSHKAASSITSSPYFVIGLAQRTIVFFYLRDPDIKHAFGVPEGEA